VKGDQGRANVAAAARAHRRVAAAIIGTILVLYFGLILLIALAKPLLGRLLAPGLSLAILLGAVVTVAAWILTLVYVRWANRYYDRPGRGLSS
jgi:uncharacterized membrane protein (DUF485 family)